MNLSENQKNAKEAYLNAQAKTMLVRYQQVSQIERKAILNQIDSFLCTLKDDEKIFWLKFRAKLVAIDAPKFVLGRIFLTQGAIESLSEATQQPGEFLARHQRGDWGEVDEGDAKENEFSLNKRLRILSSYKTALGVKLWIITEADRRSTTILLPEEY
jgi:hypothetical protein